MFTSAALRGNRHLGDPRLQCGSHVPELRVSVCIEQRSVGENLPLCFDCRETGPVPLTLYTRTTVPPGNPCVPPP